MRSTGLVRSSEPGQNKPAEIEFMDGQPVSDHSIFIMNGYDGTDLSESWCPNVNFFADRLDAEAWATKAGLQGDILPIAAIASEAAAIWGPVVAPDDNELSR